MPARGPAGSKAGRGGGPGPAASARPSVGELLARPPAWPREWAQRIGQEASKLGGRTEVRRSRSGTDWEVRWTLDHRALITLRPGPTLVEVQADVPEAKVAHVLADPETDGEFQQQLQDAPSFRGRRRVVVPLGSARRVNTISALLRTLARGGG